ncbi:MAG: hypothetical protein QOK12_894 [Mycobacterium sp.]|nr:hypothetical protein [Mycobacterium sp.]
MVVLTGGSDQPQLPLATPSCHYHLRILDDKRASEAQRGPVAVVITDVTLGEPEGPDRRADARSRRHQPDREKDTEQGNRDQGSKGQQDAPRLHARTIAYTSTARERSRAGTGVETAGERSLRAWSGTYPTSKHGTVSSCQGRDTIILKLGRGSADGRSRAFAGMGSEACSP